MSYNGGGKETIWHWILEEAGKESKRSVREDFWGEIEESYLRRRGHRARQLDVADALRFFDPEGTKQPISTRRDGLARAYWPGSAS
jgi:hypothetical protein